MQAIVVGAGIAGLVTARQLGLAGWEVDVAEKSSGPRWDGYMMDFFGPGVEASERIGLYPRLSEVAYHVEAAEYVDAEERVTARLDYDQFARLAGGKVLSLLRPDMERAALAALDDVPAGHIRVHYGTHVTGVSLDDGTARIVVDGSPLPMAAFDLVVGADGIHSEVRAQLFGPEADYLRRLGMRAAAFIVTEPELNDRFRNRFVLTDSIDRAAGFYSLRAQQVAAFLVVSSEGEVAQPEVDPGDGDGDGGDDDAVAGEVPERDRVAVAGGDADDHDVGAGADRGGVAAEVGAEGQRPPQRLRGLRRRAPASTRLCTSGVMVATYGMLSTIPDSTAEPHSSTDDASR